MPDIAAGTIPYFYDAVMTRLETWFENYEALLKDTFVEALKLTVVETLKDIAISYVIKKIGERVIPVVNVIAAVKDVIERDHERDTIAINCVRLYMKGLRQDDQTLAVKILANIMAEAFEEKIRRAIMNAAIKGGIKLVRATRRAVSRRSPALRPQAPPSPEPEAPSQPAAAPPASSPGGLTDQDRALIAKGWQVFHETRAAQEQDVQRPLMERPDGRPAPASRTKSSKDEEQATSPAQAHRTDKPRSQNEDEEEESRELTSGKSGAQGRAAPGRDTATKKTSQRIRRAPLIPEPMTRGPHGRHPRRRLRLRRRPYRLAGPGWRAGDLAGKVVAAPRPGSRATSVSSSCHRAVAITCYEYFDEQGKLLYVGQSGGKKSHRSWIHRLEEEHINEPWIGDARRVQVHVRPQPSRNDGPRGDVDSDRSIQHQAQRLSG